MELIELMVVRGGRRDFFLCRVVSSTNNTKQESRWPGFLSLNQTGESPESNRGIPGIERVILFQDFRQKPAFLNVPWNSGNLAANHKTLKSSLLVAREQPM